MQKLDATLLLLQEEYRERLAKIAALPNVVHIEADKSHPLQPNVGVPEINANQVWTATPGSTGAGVIVGIIDTAIDIFHPCFRKANGTPRIRWIWDQSLTPVGTGHAPTGIPGLSPYGVEYTAADINAALSTPKIPFRHADLNSYGTNAVGTSATVGRAPVGRHLVAVTTAAILSSPILRDAPGLLVAQPPQVPVSKTIALSRDRRPGHPEPRGDGRVALTRRCERYDRCSLRVASRSCVVRPHLESRPVVIAQRARDCCRPGIRSSRHCPRPANHMTWRFAKEFQERDAREAAFHD